MTAYTLDNRGVRPPTSRGPVGPAGPTGGTPFLNTGQIIIPSSQLLTWHSVPIVLIAAPGAGLFISVFNCVYELIAGGTVFNMPTSQTANLQYGTGTTAQTRADTTSLLNPAFMNNASQVLLTSLGTNNVQITTPANIINKSVTLISSGADMTQGNGSLAVNITYQIVLAT